MPVNRTSMPVNKDTKLQKAETHHAFILNVIGNQSYLRNKKRKSHKSVTLFEKDFIKDENIRTDIHTTWQCNLTASSYYIPSNGKA